MVTIMTLLIVCAVFAILGGLAFTEVRSLQFRLQEATRHYVEAITALDVYRARVEDNRRRAEMYVGLYEKSQSDWNTLNGLYSSHRNSSAELLRLHDLLRINHASLKALYETTFEEVKVLRVQAKEFRLMKDSLPDWAGGDPIENVD